MVMLWRQNKAKKAFTDPYNGREELLLFINIIVETLASSALGA